MDYYSMIERPTCISSSIWNRLDKWAQIKLIGSTPNTIRIPACGCIYIKGNLMGKTTIESINIDHMCKKHYKEIVKIHREQNEMKKINTNKKRK